MPTYVVAQDGPEAIEDAIANTLRTKVNDYLDAVWVAWATSDTANGYHIPKVYPLQVVSGRRTLVANFPTYIVRSLDGHLDEDAAPHFGYMAHRFQIIVLCQSSEEHILDVQVKRHLTAIRKCLGNNVTLDGSIGGILGIQLTYYGKSMPAKDKLAMEQAGAWLATVRVEEVYL